MKNMLKNPEKSPEKSLATSMTSTVLFMAKLVTLSGTAGNIGLMLAVPFMTANHSIYVSEDRVDPDTHRIVYHKGDLSEICHSFIDRPMVSHHTWIFSVQLVVIMHFMALCLMADHYDGPLMLTGKTVCILGWGTQLTGSFAILVMSRYDYEERLHLASVIVFALSTFLYHLLIVQCIQGGNIYKWYFTAFHRYLMFTFVAVVLIRIIQPFGDPDYRNVTVHSWIISYLLMFMELGHCAWLIIFLWSKALPPDSV
jgi:hypothetical protein